MRVYRQMGRVMTSWSERVRPYLPLLKRLEEYRRCPRPQTTHNMISPVRYFDCFSHGILHVDTCSGEDLTCYLCCMLRYIGCFKSNAYISKNTHWF